MSRGSLALPARLLSVLSTDIGIILLQRLWQAGAGLLTIVLAVRFLTAAEQGWYYSFLSLAALYTLFDLGLSLVLVQVAAHLFVGAEWRPHGALEGPNREQILALLARASRWYMALAALFIVVAIPGGLLFLGARADQGSAWETPWIVMSVATGAGLLALPYLALLEGGGRIREAYALRLLQGVCGSVACWLALISGNGLWAAVMAPLMTALVPAAWLTSRQLALLRGAWHNSGRAFAWRREIWPMQWRLAAGWLCAYLMTQIYTPILFRTHGPVAAGKMGLTLAIANMLGLLAQSWIVRRVPAMAAAAARREWKKLDGLFRADFIVSTAALVAGIAVICGLRIALDNTRFGERMLPVGEFAGLMVVILLNHVVGALAAQLRSFRREPFIPITVLSTAMTVPAALWAAQRYSSAGIVMVLLAVNLAFSLPVALYVWTKCNQTWRK